MAINQYNDPLLPVWYTDGQGNKINIEITNDYYKIVNNKIQLSGIPSDYFKINNIIVNTTPSTTLYETKIGSIINQNNFTVDYNLGIITVDSTYDGKTALVSSWKSRGAIFFPASKVYDVVEGEIINGEFLGKTLQDYINEIQKYVYKGIYDETETYYMNNVVFYKGTTFLVINDNNGVGITNINPNNQDYWRSLATGMDYRLDYVSDMQYYKNDLVSFGGDIYICIQDSLNNLPSDPLYWRIFAKRGENFFYYDSNVEITHNLNTYNIKALVISESTYGHGGYGSFGSENKYQLENVIEYIDLNTVRIHWSEYFIGTPSLTTIISGEEYEISFSDEPTILKIYLN